MTPIEISNIALAELEMPPIESFDDGTETARACEAVIYSVIRSVLRMYPWNCARRRVLLARLATAPAWGYRYQYELPAAALFVEVVDDDPTLMWERVGNVIETDHPGPLNVLYTSDLTLDPVTLVQVTAGADIAVDELTGMAIAYRLAQMLAKRMTGADTSRERLGDAFMQAQLLAQSVDATEGRPRVINTSSWVDPE